MLATSSRPVNQQSQYLLSAILKSMRSLIVHFDIIYKNMCHRIFLIVVDMRMMLTPAKGSLPPLGSGTILALFRHSNATIPQKETDILDASAI